ncbi:MAG: hypothetical protein HY402_01860 [Elusimicrobia bacterium]|nr:hypothetical protein [Elusimicrobiota bacterium]
MFTPIPLGQAQVLEANNVEASGVFTFVTTGGGLTAVDVFNPLNPKVIGSVGLGGSSADLAVSGNPVYYADSRPVCLAFLTTAC